MPEAISPHDKVMLLQNVWPGSEMMHHESTLHGDYEIHLQHARLLSGCGRETLAQGLTDLSQRSSSDENAESAKQQFPAERHDLVVAVLWLTICDQKVVWIIFVSDVVCHKLRPACRCLVGSSKCVPRALHIETKDGRNTDRDCHDTNCGKC